MPTKKITVTAHTGCMNTKPNSIESIEAGFQIGADIAEIDIRFASDKTPLLTHNTLSAGQEKAAVTLSEAFDVLRSYPEKKLNLDLKETTGMPEIQRLAQEKGVLPQIFFTGVFPSFVRPVKEGAPKIPYYLNFNYPSFLATSPVFLRVLLGKVKRLGAIGLNLNKAGCSEKLIHRFHEAGLLVSVWTISDLSAAKKYAAMQPDNITCKNPDEVLRLLG